VPSAAQSPCSRRQYRAREYDLSLAMPGTAFNFAVLAELLVARLTPTLPDGVSVRQGTQGDAEDLRPSHAVWRVPGFPTPPQYDLGDGVIIVHVRPPPARRLIPINLSHHRTLSDEALAMMVDEALQAVADEASEASAEHYESDAAVDAGQLRLWFGLVPPETAQGRQWREVIAELPAIPITDIRQ
jgi:hypothetical protein